MIEDKRPLVEKLDTPEKRRAHDRMRKAKWRARKRAEIDAAFEATPMCTPAPFLHN